MVNKTVIITGASKGIGRETAKLFAFNGYNVIANYNKSEKEAKSLLNELKNNGYSIEIFKADVKNKKEVTDMIECTLSKFKNIDVLVNNAGIAGSKAFVDITEQDWDLMFDINMKGMYFTTQAVLNNMLKNKSGKIINISSIWGMTGSSTEVHYSASKAAVIGFTKALAKELGPSNIQVNAVAPGIIDTDMLSEYSKNEINDLANITPLGRIGTPRDIAESVYYLASEKSSFLTGQVISPNGGFLI